MAFSTDNNKEMAAVAFRQPESRNTMKEHNFFKKTIKVCKVLKIKLQGIF
jgi:hypothetical protein